MSQCQTCTSPLCIITKSSLLSAFPFKWLSQILAKNEDESLLLKMLHFQCACTSDTIKLDRTIMVNYIHTSTTLGQAFKCAENNHCVPSNEHFFHYFIPRLRLECAVLCFLHLRLKSGSISFP